MCSLMMNSIRARPTPSFGSMAVRNASSGLPRFNMMAVRGRLSSAASTRVVSNGSWPSYTRPMSPSAQDTVTTRPVLSARLRSRRSDDGRNAELACNNGGVAGPPAALRHDRGRDLHDRLPIRAGRVCHQNLARLEGCEAVSVGNDPRGPDRDLLTDRSTRGQHRGGSLEGIAFERRRRPARGHRFGSSLDHVELSVIGILGPFDIHRHRMPGLRRVMVLDRDGVVGKLEHLRVVDAEALAQRLRNGDVSSYRS